VGLRGPARPAGGRLDRDLLARLADYRARHGLTGWDETVQKLLAEDGQKLLAKDGQTLLAEDGQKLLAEDGQKLLAGDGMAGDGMAGS
jgi:hypothetical protein